MDVNNSEKNGDDINAFDVSGPMQGFPGGFQPGLHPSAPPYQYFHGGWSAAVNAAINQGFVPYPVPPPPHGAPYPIPPSQGNASYPIPPSQGSSYTIPPSQAGAPYLIPASQAGAPYLIPPSPVESDAPETIKESQGEVEGGSLTVPRRRKGKGKGTPTSTRPKLSNFSPKEDVFLVKSWLEISCDPITNTRQKKEGFWARIYGQYNQKRGPYPKRNTRSLQSRWEHIKAEGSKFAEYMTSVLRDNPSGMSDADKTSLALANFADIELYPFTLMHCWDLLKDEPKWMEINHKRVQLVEDDGISDHIPPNSNTIDLDPESPSPQQSRGKRPIGRDAAKSAAKKAASSSGSESSQYASKLQDLSIQKMALWQEENVKKSTRFKEMADIEAERFEEVRKHNAHMAAIEEEKLQLMRTKVHLQERREEERLLGINPEQHHPRLRKFYAAHQAEIMRKFENDGENNPDQ